MSDSHEKTLTDKVSFHTEEPSLICVKRTKLKSDLNEMTTLVLRMKNDVDKSFSNMSTEVKKTYEKMVKAEKLKLQADFFHGWKKMETHFQVEYARLAVSTEDDLLRRSSDVKKSPGKSFVLFCSCVAKALDVCSSSSESSSVSAKTRKQPRRKSGSERARKRTKFPSGGKNNIDIDKAQADVL